VKVRLHGTREEVAEATRRLAEAFQVVAVSRPYPDRGRSVLVRVYLELRLTPAGQPSPAAAAGRRSA
jgi:Protein of unknown function (DUF3970)